MSRAGLVRLGRWWLRHRRWWWLHMVIHRLPRCLVCRAVWAEFLSDPKTVASLKEGIADVDAGRWYHYDTTTGVSTPNPDWPKDGPQPESTDFWRYVDPDAFHDAASGEPVVAPAPARGTDTSVPATGSRPHTLYVADPDELADYTFDPADRPWVPINDELAGSPVDAARRRGEI